MLTHCAVMLGLVACGAGRPWTPAVPAPSDGEVIQAQGSLSILVMGGNPSASALQVAAGSEADLIALVGGYVEANRRAWVREVGPLASLSGRLLAVPQKPQRVWRETFQVTPKDLPDSSWYHLDIRVDARVWRLLILDSDPDLDASLRLTQRTWIPKVVGRGDFDRLVVFMADPPRSLVEVEPEQLDSARDLLSVVESHAPPLALTLVLTGGAPTHEAHLPDGPFGAFHIAAGNTDQPAVDLPRSRDGMGLVNGFDNALMQLWAAQGGAPNTTVWSAEQMPLQGTWQVTLGQEAVLAFNLGTHGEAIYRARFTTEQGWLGN